MHPRVTFLISTYNRRDVLISTLWRVHECGLRRDAFEIIVVDNASRDGTAQAVATQFPRVRMIALRENLGSCAKNEGLKIAQGDLVVFLDDDSYPQPGAIARMFSHFADDLALGAAVFTINLRDGSRECSAYRDVFIGCGTAFRRAALEQVGGLPDDFFMQAEEYDLSLRLLDAGWKIRTFEDLHVTHLKTSTARISRRTTRLDVRNNLLLIARRFPDRWVLPFAIDWMRRYYAIARARQHRIPFWGGLIQGILGAASIERRAPVSSRTFEQFARVRQIEQRMRSVNIRRALFVDYGKNILAYWMAAQSCGIEIVAIADDRLAGARYHGIPVVTDESAREMQFDAAIISNSSPVHATNRCALWRALIRQPVVDLLENSPTPIAAAAPALESRQIAAQIASRAA